MELSGVYILMLGNAYNKSAVIGNLKSSEISKEISRLLNNLSLKQTEAGLLNKRLMLSSSFRCDKFLSTRYDLGHTVVLLKSDLDVQILLA